MSHGSVMLVEEGGRGGVADYTAELARALALDGWSVEVATACDHLYPPCPGVRIHRIFPYVRRSRLGRLIRRVGLSKAVNGLLHLGANVVLLGRLRRCEIVHVQGAEWPPLGLVQALLIRARGKPLVWTPHNTFDRGEREYAGTRALTARCASAIVIHAEHDRRALPAAVLARARVIPHGEYGGLGRRDRDGRVADAHAPAVDRNGDLIVLLFGQLRPDKGVGDLLHAAAEVPGIEVWLVGEDGGVLATVGGLLADPRLAGRVSVREGFLPIEEVPALLAAADVVALPYHRASASGVLMLAYGNGRPVVAYPVGGIPEYVIDGETGWLCARPDPAALAEALVAVRDAGRAACRRRGAAARRVADERYSWPAVARRTADVYHDVLGARA